MKTRYDIPLKMLGIVLVLNFLNYHYCSAQAAYQRPLKHPSIERGDGMPGLLDGRAIAKLIGILSKVDRILYGAYRDGGRIGLYDFNNKKYSVYEFSALEKELNMRHDISVDEKQSTKNLLQATLVTVKKDFIDIMQPFITQARASKGATVKIVEEWLSLHKRFDSFLHILIKQTENREVDCFNRTINSFESLEIFCLDLMSFLEDLIKSCPFGFKQYNNLVQESAKK